MLWKVSYIVTGIDQFATLGGSDMRICEWIKLNKYNDEMTTITWVSGRDFSVTGVLLVFQISINYGRLFGYLLALLT